jgi:hypothetical protein
MICILEFLSFLKKDQFSFGGFKSPSLLQRGHRTFEEEGLLMSFKVKGQMTMLGAFLSLKYLEIQG